MLSIYIETLNERLRILHIAELGELDVSVHASECLLRILHRITCKPLSNRSGIHDEMSEIYDPDYSLFQYKVYLHPYFRGEVGGGLLGAEDAFSCDT